MLKKINTNHQIIKSKGQIKLKILKLNVSDIILSYIVFKDMMFYIKIWRQIKGYSSNGQRSHSNNKNNKKNKILLNYRVQQFYVLFGKKRRDIFPSLIIAEYNNRLWRVMWYFKWAEASMFVLFLALKNRGKVKFDPQLMSKNIVTGIKSIRKKKKHNVGKKKELLVATIGLPIMFSSYFYNNIVTKEVPYKLIIPNESRRKMAKKSKKIKKKK